MSLGSWASWSSFAGNLVGRLVSPARCAACDARVAWIAAFCPACASTAQRAAENGAGRSVPLVAAFVYGGAIARTIARLKYERRPDLSRPLGDLLWRAVKPHAPAFALRVVVPVPLHPSRLAERGYNQSALVARPVAQRLGAPFWPMALVRVRDTPRQASLDRACRLTNVRGAFEVRQRERVRGRDILLVDDVCTTGATLDACSIAMRDAGVRSVAYAVVARSDWPQDQGAQQNVVALPASMVTLPVGPESATPEHAEAPVGR
jgi:ComF family protein